MAKRPKQKRPQVMADPRIVSVIRAIRDWLNGLESVNDLGQIVSPDEMHEKLCRVDKILDLATQEHVMELVDV